MWPNSRRFCVSLGPGISLDSDGRCKGPNTDKYRCVLKIRNIIKVCLFLELKFEKLLKHYTQNDFVQAKFSFLCNYKITQENFFFYLKNTTELTTVLTRSTKRVSIKRSSLEIESSVVGKRVIENQGWGFLRCQYHFLSCVNSCMF